MPDSSFLSGRPGVLPEVSEPIVGSVQLPIGRRVVPDSSISDGLQSPALWITAEPVDTIGPMWASLSQQFPSSGLWPLVLESLRRQEERPWLSGEFDPSASSDPDSQIAEDVFRQMWDWIAAEEEPEELDVIAPLNREFPGLAQAETLVTFPDSPELVADQLSGRLGLVAATRPADVLSVVGWRGPVNHKINDMAALSCMMRSWEDRFGAFLVGVGFDTLALAVQRPPTTVDKAIILAAEHLAICPDNIDWVDGALRHYAEGLVGAPAWQFWWD